METLTKEQQMRVDLIAKHRREVFGEHADDDVRVFDGEPSTSYAETKHLNHDSGNGICKDGVWCYATAEEQEKYRS
jgi:hypothetical protein